MLGVLYDLFITLYAIASSPKIAWQMLKKNDKYNGTILQRLLGPGSIDTKGKAFVIWFHAVSLGETNAALPLVKYYRQKYPESFILFSCSTKTGAANVVRKMPEVDQQIFLPLDFSWVMRPLMHQLKPKLVIVIEGEFWFNFFKAAKEVGAKLILASGKISDRSFKRFSKIKRFSSMLFSQFDLLCMQNQGYLDKIATFTGKTCINAGNLKFDVKKEKMEEEALLALKNRLGITQNEKVIAIVSTHSGEEQAILKALEPLFSKFHLRILLAPRHPERFEKVAKELTDAGFFLEIYEERAHEPIILVNRMGVLDGCYQIADAVIMGGSFNPHIGGHNILEPIEFRKLTLFGPHMHAQKELSKEVLEAKAGVQVTLEEIAGVLEHYLLHEEEYEQISAACTKLLENVKGAAGKTCYFIDQLVENAL